MIENRYILGCICFLLLCMISCDQGATTLPKPRMYPKVVYPAKDYTAFDSSLCNFSFKMPTYAAISQDSFVFEGKPSHPCWFDINVPALNASIYCSYYDITQEKSLTDLINDAFYIASKHNSKANYRKETIINTAHGMQGIMFEIDGPVASPVQFYLTDEKKHFFRGSLYFNSKVNPDSTAPMLVYLKKDIDTLISSFQWKMN